MTYINSWKLGVGLLLGSLLVLGGCSQKKHINDNSSDTSMDAKEHHGEPAHEAMHHDTMHHDGVDHGDMAHMHHDMGDHDMDDMKVPYTKPPMLKSPQELVGKSLPAIPLDGADGSSAKLTVVDGKPTVLVMWSTWCQACLHETHELVDWAGARDDVAFLPININGISGEPADVPMVLSYAKKVGLTGPVWITDADNLSGLGVQTCPTSFVVDKDGIVKAARVGYNGRADMDQWLDRELHSL